MNRFVLVAVLALAVHGTAAAEDGRRQYPGWLADSYFDFGVGYVRYPFSPLQLEPGYNVAAVEVPHAGARVTLFGHNFNERLSAQITYLRPIQWVRYRDVNGIPAARTVWMNVAGLTARGTWPLVDQLSVYAEGGLGIVTRHGFGDHGTPIVTDANYATVLLGTGLKYRLGNTWDLQAGAAYTPPNSRYRQPHTLMFSLSAVVNMRPSGTRPVGAFAEDGSIFPEHQFQAAFTTNALGTGVNTLVAKKVPIFWGGSLEARQGVAVRYQRNMYHTAKLFSLDLGVSISGYESKRDRTDFWAFSAYPKFTFRVLRTQRAAVSFYYSVAGPTYLTRSFVDSIDTGKRFTFQDLIGIGFAFGRSRHATLELGVGHYSNGNIFTRNAGVKIPLTTSFGYAF